MECISFVSYKIIVNGKNSNTIFPSRGLRQGDPLSPYLFLFVIDDLSRMVNKALKSRSLAGIKLSREWPVVSHLLFADDSLFFLLVDVNNCDEMRKLLKRYCECSGQVINLNKSNMVFSSNVPK